MKRAPWYLSLLLATPCATSQTQDNLPPAITVYTQFDHPAAAAPLDEMTREMESIMNPLGLGFTWRSLDSVHGNEVSAELVVVTFRGKCQMQDEVTAGHPGENGALGWTHMSDGIVLPFSEVDCDKIRHFIAVEIRGRDTTAREIAYGRAMGRVLSHELYHVFTNTTRHASWGVAKSCYSSRDLVSDKFQFQEKDTNALRSGKLKALLQRKQQRPPVLGFAAARK